MSRAYARAGAILAVVIRPMMRYYFSKRPSRRVRVVVFDHKGNMLLIKGWLSRQRWDLPGGGINKGEHDADAAVRELYEETGLTVKTNQLTFLGEFFYTDMATPYTVVLYMVKTKQVATKTPRKYRWEIIDQGWFSVKKLPQNISLLVSRSLQKASELE